MFDEEEYNDLRDYCSTVEDERDEYMRVLTECFHAFHEACPVMANRFYWSEFDTMKELIPPNLFLKFPGNCIYETGIQRGQSWCEGMDSYTDCRITGKCRFNHD